MDRTFKLLDLEFEWDEEKYAVNVRKHDIKFEEAAEVFFDPEQQFGDASAEEEAREFIVGFTFGLDLLYTAFVERGQDSE